MYPEESNYGWDDTSLSSIFDAAANYFKQVRGPVLTVAQSKHYKKILSESIVNLKKDNEKLSKELAELLKHF